jgi:hypothetical protein
MSFLAGGQNRSPRVPVIAMRRSSFHRHFAEGFNRRDFDEDMIIRGAKINKLHGKGNEKSDPCFDSLRTVATAL